MSDVITSYPTSVNGIFVLIIKYQTLDKNISNFIFYRLEFSEIIFRDKIVSFHIWTNSKIQVLHRE